MLNEFRSARKVAVPLIAISTADQLATAAQLAGTANPEKVAVIQWDIVRGAVGINNDGDAAPNSRGHKLLKDAFPDDDPPYARHLAALLGNPDIGNAQNTIIIAMNAQRYLDDPQVVQGICNLRNVYSQQASCVVLLGPSFDFPPEIGGDILTIDEPLPATSKVAEIVKEVLEDSKVVQATDDQLHKASEALTGLTAFSVEQATALSIAEGGFDQEQLWARKIAMINATPGLNVYDGKERFADIGGVENVKNYLGRLLNGPMAPNAIVFIDEIEKAIGTDQDTSGVSQSLLGTMLTWMQNTRAGGIIFIGPPGAAKSVVAKATGNEAGIPTIEFDLSGMKGSLVGQSEQNLRTALKVVDAVGQGKVLVLATCNKLTNLPPELRRRFKRGTFFFDLPTQEERDAIWPLYVKKYAIDGSFTFSDENWTGAEIEGACETAYALNCSLDEASRYIVPVSVSAKKQIDTLREEASLRFTSASYPGIYDVNHNKAEGPKRRKLNALD